MQNRSTVRRVRLRISLFAEIFVDCALALVGANLLGPFLETSNCSTSVVVGELREG